MAKITNNQVILPEILSKKIQNKLKKDQKDMTKKDFIAFIEFVINDLYEKSTCVDKRLDLVFDDLQEQFKNKKANEKR